MTLTEAVVCGVIQGLAEFLPISSSGHLALAHSFFHVGTPEGCLAFDLLLHLGTLIVVFVFYHKEIFSLVPAFFTMSAKLVRGRIHISSWSKNERFVLFLIVATLPLAAAMLWEDQVEMLSAYPKIVGALLAVNGIVLLLSDRMTGYIQKRELSPLCALGIGVFQLAATFPGISRSGSTISGGMLVGLSREDAVKFSFILSVPAILGANVMSVPDVIGTPIASAEVGYYLIGMAVAMLSGFCAMKFLLYISKKSRFGFFAYYCMAAGLLAVMLA